MYIAYAVAEFVSKITTSHNYELLCFQHALSTPLTILLNVTEEVSTLTEHKNRNKYHYAVKTLQQLFKHFSLPGTTKCEIGALLEEVKVLLENTGIEIVLCNLSKENAVISNVQPVRLKEALICLIKNAIQASEENNTSVLVAYQVIDTKLHIHVKDFGKGFAWWQRYLAFLPLVTFKQSGTGMGLYFARKVIINELGGMMALHSKGKTGTSIECVIPMCR